MLAGRLRGYPIPLPGIQAAVCSGELQTIAASYHTPLAALPEPAPRPEIRGVVATLCHGAGAQSLFALVKRGRHFALAALLIKIEVGVADAWVTEGMSDLVAWICQESGKISGLR